jgi:hypothetical protein
MKLSTLGLLLFASSLTLGCTNPAHQIVNDWCPASANPDTLVANLNVPGTKVPWDLTILPGTSTGISVNNPRGADIDFSGTARPISVTLYLNDPNSDIVFYRDNKTNGLDFQDRYADNYGPTMRTVGPFDLQISHFKIHQPDRKSVSFCYRNMRKQDTEDPDRFKFSRYALWLFDSKNPSGQAFEVDPQIGNR